MRTKEDIQHEINRITEAIRQYLETERDLTQLGVDPHSIRSSRDKLEKALEVLEWVVN